MNFTDCSRSDVCCYSSFIDNAVLCNDKGGTTAITDLLFFRTEAELLGQIINGYLKSKIIPWNIFVFPYQPNKKNVLQIFVRKNLF